MEDNYIYLEDGVSRWQVSFLRVFRFRILDFLLEFWFLCEGFGRGRRVFVLLLLRIFLGSLGQRGSQKYRLYSIGFGVGLGLIWVVIGFYLIFLYLQVLCKGLDIQVYWFYGLIFYYQSQLLGFLVTLLDVCQIYLGVFRFLEFQVFLLMYQCS